MTKREQLTSIIRHLLSAVAGYFVLQGIDSGLAETAIGVAMGIASVVWSFIDKTATQSSVGGVLRQVATFVGGIFIAKGDLDPAQLDTYLGLLTALIPVVLAKLDKDKAPTE